MISITEKEFRQLADYIQKNYGIHLKSEKQSLVTGRLQHILLCKKMESFSEYIDYVMSDRSGEAANTLAESITTHHTFFMRESDHFYYFRDKALPFLSANVKDKDLRIWCAACSTGEEAYTLAMVLDEFFGKEKILWDTGVLATDISDKVLNIARAGIYRKESIASLPGHWRLNYFKEYDAEHFILTDKIRHEVIYRKFNLMEPVFPFKKKFHAVFCRNVMIYFDQRTKNNLAEKLYDMLEYDGYLFVGHSESLNREITRLKYIMPSVYRKV